MILVVHRERIFGNHSEVPPNCRVEFRHRTRMSANVVAPQKPTSQALRRPDRIHDDYLAAANAGEFGERGVERRVVEVVADEHQQPEVERGGSYWKLVASAWIAMANACFWRSIANFAASMSATV